MVAPPAADRAAGVLPSGLALPASTVTDVTAAMIDPRRFHAELGDPLQLDKDK